MTFLSAGLTSKAQLTLPKQVRALLGVQAKGDRIGFLIDEKTHRITLTRVEFTATEAPWTQTEVRKLLRISKERGKTFASGKEFLKHLHAL